MSFLDAVRSAYRNYANFEDRAPRSEYWWCQLFFVLIIVGGTALAFVLRDVTHSSFVFTVVFWVMVGIVVASIIPSLALIVRRLHDSDMAGAWLLISFIPFGSFVLLVFMLLPSTPGVNRYGPPIGKDADFLQAHYPGPTRPEAWGRFTEDGPRAAAAGYQPVLQRWRYRNGGESLDVTYQRPKLDPPWMAPDSRRPIDPRQ